MRLVGLLISIIALTYLIHLGGGISLYFKPYMVLITFVIPIGLLLMSHGVYTFNYGWQSVKWLIGIELYADGYFIKTTQALIRYFYVAALLGLLIGMVNIGQDYDQWLLGVGALFLAPLYSIVVAEIWLRPMGLSTELIY